MQLSDEEIIKLIKTKNNVSFAFTKLVEKYREKIYWLIRRMVIEHEDADDLTQEVFIKIWKNIGDFRGDASLFTWIYRIAINVTITFLNRKKHFPVYSTEIIENRLQKTSDNSSDKSGDEILKILYLTLEKLPEKQKLVFHLRYFQEMSYEEISAITKTSVGALKASFHHAIKKIEHLLFISY